MLRSLLTAFAMYSKIPVPHMKWQEEDMKYTLSFFPFVGLVIAGAEYLCYIVLSGYSQIFRTAAAFSLPVLISGGIHLDGFMDTSDALSSYRSREDRLRILKDPHIGAFAVIHMIVLSVLFFGGIYEVMEFTLVNGKGIFYIFCLSFILSRIESGLSAMVTGSARSGGTLDTFRNASDKKKVLIMLGIEFAVTAILMLLSSGFPGAAVISVSLCFFLFYRNMTIKTFGGVTGDTSGWFLCVNECLCVLALAAAAHL